MRIQSIMTDVLVVGSGPAGFSAAYTAAKNGMNVILIEQCGDIPRNLEKKRREERR